MFLLNKPSDENICAFIAQQSGSAVSYEAVGATRSDAAPPGFTVDHNRLCLGSGAETFRKASEAIRHWQMFNMPQAQLCWPDTPIEAGRNVAVVFHHFGLWSMNAARIVYVLEERDDIEKFGFAYGTLLDHAESGEERFSVEWNHADNSVHYDLFAFSKPQHPLAKLATPLARRLQRRFVRASQAAMFRAVNGP